MNETNSTISSAVVEHAHAAPVDLVQLLHTYLPREALRRVVIAQVKGALDDYLRNSGDADGASVAEAAPASSNPIARLRLAAAVALPPELCTLMARLGFDKSLFTYGQIDGRSLGFAEGIWLLKFVGLADEGSMAVPELSFPSRQRVLARQA